MRSNERNAYSAKRMARDRSGPVMVAGDANLISDIEQRHQTHNNQHIPCTQEMSNGMGRTHDITAKIAMSSAFHRRYCGCAVLLAA